MYFPTQNELENGKIHFKDFDKKKQTLMVIKSLMRLKTTKHEVYIFQDQQSGSSDSMSSVSTNMDQVNTSRSVDEKMKRVNSPEQLDASSGFHGAENFQTPQSKQFVRNYLKTKAGSVNDLTIGINESSSEPNHRDHDFSKNVNFYAHDSDDEICMTAVALKNCVPSPYDSEALAFKKGDVIKVTTMNTNGWLH